MFKITHNGEFEPASIELPISKSIANRILALNFSLQQAIDLGTDIPDDVKVLQSCFRKIKKPSNQDHVIIDAQDAGTAFRILTSALSFTPGLWVLKGSGRMHQRPIGDLVEALNAAGANIEYTEERGFPPLTIHGRHAPKSFNTSIKAYRSSQYISSILLMAPLFEDGIALQVEGNVVSRPYIEMTLGILTQYGFKVSKETTGELSLIKIAEGKVGQRSMMRIEKDWSSSAFFYLLTAIGNYSDIKLPGLTPSQMQGDSALSKLFQSIGVSSTERLNEIELQQTRPQQASLQINFTDIPDLAPSLILACAVKGVSLRCLGMDHLRLKESDRIGAMNYNLKQLGYSLEQSDKSFKLGKFGPLQEQLIFNSFDDHRMVMSFAMMAIIKPVYFDEIHCVSKSFPNFWIEMEKLGFKFEKVDGV